MTNWEKWEKESREARAREVNGVVVFLQEARHDLRNRTVSGIQDLLDSVGWWVASDVIVEACDKIGLEPWRGYDLTCFTAGDRVQSIERDNGFKSVSGVVKCTDGPHVYVQVGDDFRRFHAFDLEASP